MPTQTCCRQLSCSPPHPADPPRPHRQVAPETQHGNSALLLKLRSFNALPLCSGSVYQLLLTNEREKGRNAHVGEWVVDLPKGQCLWCEGEQLWCCSLRRKHLSNPSVGAFPISYCSTFSISAAESTREKRSVSLIKVFLQFWPEIPFWSQESFSSTNLWKLVHCHEIFWFGELAFPVKNYFMIFFFPEIDLLVSVEPQIGKVRSWYGMGEGFISPYEFHFCKWSLKSFLCEIKLTLQENMRQLVKHSPLTVSNLPVDLYKISFIPPLSREILVLLWKVS